MSASVKSEDSYSPTALMDGPLFELKPTTMSASIQSQFLLPSTMSTSSASNQPLPQVVPVPILCIGDIRNVQQLIQPIYGAMQSLQNLSNANVTYAPFINFAQQNGDIQNPGTSGSPSPNNFESPASNMMTLSDELGLSRRKRGRNALSPTKCPYCPKTFTRHWLLQGHLRVHSEFIF
ncbi:hypothetical protein WR25_07705 isoform C [Diploscapter pachys]|uniref:C2H2-type domain-containing protein n=1 Tax=Diploscapter pachys TaxID=2018661 RepID=A0A2A2L165_9BILA|nr:hypothetical protein WR25_07705 isoform C [Diploscapter pachys]